MITYEQRLNGDFQLALREGDMFFQGEGAVQKTLYKIKQRLAEIGVDYAVARGMAFSRAVSGDTRKTSIFS